MREQKYNTLCVRRSSTAVDGKIKNINSINHQLPLETAINRPSTAINKHQSNNRKQPELVDCHTFPNSKLSAEHVVRLDFVVNRYPSYLLWSILWTKSWNLLASHHTSGINSQLRIVNEGEQWVENVQLIIYHCMFVLKLCCYMHAVNHMVRLPSTWTNQGWRP